MTRKKPSLSSRERIADEEGMSDQTIPMHAAVHAPLSATAKKFVRDWGALGARWGIDQRAAEVHAFLLVAPKPMTIAEIEETLDLDIGEAKKSVDTLRDWRIVREASAGQWESLPDVLEMFRNILDERRRREMDPAMAVLRDCVQRADADPKAERHVIRRLEELQEVLRLAQSFYKMVGTMPTAETRKMLKLGQKIRQTLGG